MTSHAPRTPNFRDPSWKDVSIHWTDSATDRFDPVDGLPWIRMTAKAKLFNKNKPLRVVARYRTNDGLDPNRQFKHVSIIADAIEQYVLVEITLPKEVPVQPGVGWPTFRLWAFLQPPTIGHSKRRVEENHGYVVDDTPRAGWFETIVDGPTLTATERDYSAGHQKPPTSKLSKVWASRDAHRPNVVRFKILVRVANNESEEELREKAKALRKKKLDVSLMEAGSYVKIWVRNEERNWKQDPKDDDSEAAIQAMDSTDVIKPGSGSNPRCFKNHTWKRSRIAAHKSILNGNATTNHDEQLLYVGLYPAHLISKMEKIETEAKEAHGGKVELQKAREFSFPNWFAVTVAYGLLSYSIRKWRDKKATSKNKLGAQHGIVDATKYVNGFVEASSLPDLFAAFAVAGFSDFPKLAETFKAAEGLPNASDITKKLYVRLLQAFLELDKENQAEGAKGKLEASEVKGLSKFKPEKFWNWGALWKEQSANISLQLIEGKDKTFGPWPKLPKPLPGYLAWLGFQTKLVASGNLPIGLYADGAELGSKEGSKFTFKIATQGKEKAGVQATYSIMIRALWSYVADASISNAMKEKGKTPVLDTLKELLEVIDVEITLSPSINNEIVLAWGGEWTKLGIDPGSKKWMNDFLSKLTTVFHAQASIFQWNYDTLNGTMYEGDNDYGTFFKDVEAFGKPLPELQITYGDSPFDDTCSLASTLSPDRKPKNHEFCMGELFQLFLGYKTAAEHPEKCKAILRFASVADNVNSLNKDPSARVSIVDLANDLEVENNAPKPVAHKGEVVCTSRLTWSDINLESEKGVVNFRSLVKTKRSVMKQFFQSCINKSIIQFRPYVKLPDSNREMPLDGHSELHFLSPVMVDESGVLRRGNLPDLVWIFHLEHYADTHVWIQLKEHNLILADGLMPLRGSQKGGWKLMELKGQATSAQRLITLPLSEIGTPPDTESTYEVYLRLGLLDDDSCCFHTSKVRIELPGQLLTGKH